MKIRDFKRLAILAAASYGLTSGALAGTFKHITIDGSFEDWAGVPLAHTQEQDTTEVVAYKDIYVANDENYLYIRFTIYGSDDPFTYLQNIFIDTDNNPATGFGAHGLIGSEMLIQGGSAYDERNGTFNNGTVNGLDWMSAPTGPASEFELRIARSALFNSDNAPVFNGDTIAFVLESDNSGFANIEWVPSTVGGLAYTFAVPAPVLTENLPLVETASSWQVNASGTDLGVAWLQSDYDDTSWTSGTGLFGFTPSPGAYPAIQTPLSSGPNTYYFRTHFNWNYETADLAFVVTNYLSDGAVYYLNGTEVRRVRMPSGAVTYGTSASGTNSSPGQPAILGIPGNSLLIGDNVLEVETHQALNSAADMVFGLSLTAVTEFPVIIVDTNLPANKSVVAGQSVSFMADVLGSGPLTYEWLKDGNPIDGATNATFTIPVVLTNNIGNYSLRIANAVSTNTTRAATLSVTSTPIVFTNPALPADHVVVEGRGVTLNVAASGSALLQYQWYFGATAIPDATNNAFSIASASMTNNGNYRVMVTNPAGSTNSRTAIVTVLRDSIPATVTNVAASSTQIVIQFSEPVDAATANDAAHYSLSGGVNVLAATINPGNAAEVTLTVSAPLELGTLYSLNINGVKDLFGNATSAAVPFARGITIDGSFADWDGVAPVYSGPANLDGAADFKDIYLFNDANYYYFRVTLWHDIPSSAGQFPAYVNMFFDTDADPNTGYSAIGSDLLIQSGFSYQEKDGGFNDNKPITGFNWLSLPAAPGTDFEFRFSRAATFQDGTPVFPANALTFLFQGMTPAFEAINQAPADGGLITYTNSDSIIVPPLPIGPLAISAVPGGNAAVIWDSPGTLQTRSSLQSGNWENVIGTAPYVIPTTNGTQFFRLAK